ncbi:MAG: ABC transporter substrate-binding protein [Elusimicrobia bacterium]|nr:ABC transporter substrate-binding protein [Elusimicrobiota bacterium]
MRKALAVVALILLSCPSPAAQAADDGKQVRALIERTVDSVLDVLKDKSLAKDARKGKVLALVDPVFDLKLMGKLTLGQKNWPKLDQAQQDKYTGLFTATVKDSYYEKIDMFTNETVDFEDPVPAEKGKYQMMTRINSKGQRYGLLYKLTRREGGWKVYDVEIEGISLIRSYGAQYDQFLQKGTAAGLLAKMKEKTLETPSDLKAATKKSVSEGKKAGKP